MKTYTGASVKLMMDGKEIKPWSTNDPAPTMRRARRAHRQFVRDGVIMSFRGWARLKYKQGARGKLAQVIGS